MAEKKTLVVWWREELEKASSELGSGNVEIARARIDLASSIEYGAKVSAETAPTRARLALVEVIGTIDGIFEAPRVGSDDPVETAELEVSHLHDGLSRIRKAVAAALELEVPF